MVFQILLTIAVVSLVYCLGEGLRRLYYHPLSHIPGPKFAALTWWYEFYYDVIQPGRYIFKIQELHQKYGSCSECQRPDRLWNHEAKN
jgi:hypothetical protein